MKNTIYYFTGTGNSLKVAKDIAAGVENSSVVSMARIVESTDEQNPNGAVGFVLPVYYCGLPRLVAEFISQIDLTNAEYIYLVSTYASDVGNAGCISQTKKILKNKGKILNAAFYVKHINNFQLRVWDNNPMFVLEITPEQKHQALHESAYKKSKEIAEIVSSRKNHFDKSLMEYAGPVIFNYNHFYKTVNTNDKKFHSTDKCNSCGICTDVCPTNNMEMKDGRPVWKSKTCQRCLACLNLCPISAIEHGKETVKRRRYKNPYITINELKRQSINIGECI